MRAKFPHHIFGRNSAMDTSRASVLLETKEPSHRVQFQVNGMEAHLQSVFGSVLMQRHRFAVPYEIALFVPDRVAQAPCHFS